MKLVLQYLVLVLLFCNGVLYAQDFDQASLARLQESRMHSWGLSAIESWAHGVMATEDGMVWITSADGVIRFDGKQFMTMAPPDKKYTYFRRIFKIDDTIYLGDEDKPLHYYDTSDSIPKISKVDWQYNNDGELNIWNAYEHNDKRKFLVDHKGIIYHYQGEGILDTFFVMPTDVVQGKTLNHTARYMREDPFDSNKSWICSIHGMFHLNMTDGSYEFYYPEDQYGLHIRLEDQGYTFYDHIQLGTDLWISSFENGLVRFNTLDNSYTSFRYELPLDETVPSTNFMRAHQPYGDQNIIIGGRELMIFNTVKQRFYNFRRGHDDFDPPVLLAVDISKYDDEYYMISAGALAKFSADNNLFLSGKLSRISISDKVKNISKVEKVSSQEIKIWTNTGQIFIWDTENLILKRSDSIEIAIEERDTLTSSSNGSSYTLKDNKVYKRSTDVSEDKELIVEGLSSISGIQFDSNDDLWIKAEEGLTRYNITSNEYRIYGQYDGLWNYVWSDPGIISVFDDGSMFVSTGITFAYFDPDDLFFEAKDVIEPYAYKLEVFNETKFISRDPTEELKTTLAPEDNYFTIHYSTLLSNHGQDIEYEYMLDGYDEHWISAGQNNMATYSKVSAGEYDFLIRARYPGGKWSEVYDRLSLDLKPRFRDTLFFKMLIAFGTLFFLFALYRYRTQHLLREQELKSEFQHKLSEAKLEALRSQMNPHFLFNSLNSIDNYILTNRTKEASQYLTKFAKLIRNILDYSKRKKITLEEELATFTLYVDMEQLRFKDKFEYSIDLDEAIDPAKEFIPPSILQPYVENAIWHGLLHKGSNGILEISIRKVDAKLEISIDDNGIGRAKALSIRSKSVTKHRSHGMKITEARIRILNELHELGGKVEIIDKYDQEGEAAGTRVIITLPSIDS